MLVSVQHFVQELGSTHAEAAGFNAIAFEAQRRHWRYHAALSEDLATARGGAELDNFVEACRRASRARDDASAVSLLAHAAAVLRLTGPLNAIVSLCEPLLALDTPPIERLLRARVACIAGSAWLLQRRIERSREALREALACLVEEDAWRAMALCSLGELELLAGGPPAAQRLLEEALKVATCSKDVRQQCRALNALGALAAQEARWEDASHHYQAGLDRATADRLIRWQGLLLGNLGMVQHQIGNLDAAANHYKLSVALAEQAGDRRGEGDRRCNLGMLLLERGNLVAARAELERASAIAAATGHVRLQGITQCNLGLALESEGQPSIALAAFEAALATAIDDTRAEGQYRIYIGRTLVRLGRTEHARECLELAAALLEGIAEPTVLGLLHCAMSELAAADLDDQTAFDQLARAEQYLVRLNASQGSELGREASRVKSALQRRLKWPINPS